MNFDRLRTFRALAESLQFRKTADRRHISHPFQWDAAGGNVPPKPDGMVEFLRFNAGHW